MPLIEKFKTSLVKETFIYTATEAFGKAIGFLLLPFVSYYISPDELGIATNFSVLTSIVTLLAGQAVVNAIPYFFYEQTKADNKKMLSNLLISCCAICTFLFLVVFIFNPIIENYLKLNPFLQLFAIVTVVAGLINSVSLILLRLENKSVSFAKLQICQIILHCLAVIVFVILSKLGGIGKILSEALIAILMSIIHFRLISKKGYIEFVIDKSIILKLMKFGLPLLPHSLSFWLKGGMDKVFLTTYCGLYQNGLYSMAITITSLYTICTNAFFSAYTPYLQKKLSTLTEENEKVTKLGIVKQTYILFGLFFLVAVFAVIGAWIILYFVVDDKYEDSFPFIPWLILSQYIYSLYSFTIQFIYKMKRTLIMGIITFSGSIIHMILSFFLIKNFGTMGAVWSTLIGNILISIAISVYSNKVYPMPWLMFSERNYKSYDKQF